jgi:hypothetical protein
MCGVITPTWHHCPGCRCNAGTTTTTTAPTLVFTPTTPYAPKHRKPGPAQ